MLYRTGFLAIVIYLVTIFFMIFYWFIYKSKWSDITARGNGLWELGRCRFCRWGSSSGYGRWKILILRLFQEGIRSERLLSCSSSLFWKCCRRAFSRRSSHRPRLRCTRCRRCHRTLTPLWSTERHSREFRSTWFSCPCRWPTIRNRIICKHPW